MREFDEIVKIRIHAGTPQIWQDVHAFLTYHEGRFGQVVDVLIKMELFLIPDDIYTDVFETLRAKHIFEDIEDLEYTIAPEICPAN